MTTTNSMVTASIAERKVTALETAGARKESEKYGAADDKKKGGGSGIGATSAGVRSTLHTGAAVCARPLSTERETVRSAELKKAQCWQN